TGQMSGFGFFAHWNQQLTSRARTFLRLAFLAAYFRGGRSNAQRLPGAGRERRGMSAPRRRGRPAFRYPECIAHRVVILGGGFGGLYAARKLKHAPVEVTM